MPEIFLISDTHFGHSKVLEYEESRRMLGRNVEEHDEALVQRWNAVVRKNDTVWHLGDVLFGAHSFPTLGRLNGNKKLVMGNHDTYNVARYLEYLKDIKGVAQLDKCILSHIPLDIGQKYRYQANIHGHMHSRRMPDPWYRNVSCEQIDFQPIPFYIIRNELRSK